MLLLLSGDEELGAIELELPLGDVVLVALPLGVVTVVELLVSDELDGVALLVGGGVVVLELGGVVVVVVVLLVVPALLRSHPVAATVARARTATTGMSLFMTSPVFVMRKVG